MPKACDTSTYLCVDPVHLVAPLHNTIDLPRQTLFDCFNCSLEKRNAWIPNTHIHVSQPKGTRTKSVRREGVLNSSQLHRHGVMEGTARWCRMQELHNIHVPSIATKQKISLSFSCMHPSTDMAILTQYYAVMSNQHTHQTNGFCFPITKQPCSKRNSTPQTVS